MQIDEAGRIDALRRYAIIDTPPEPNFDRITRMAAHFFGLPFCTLAFADSDRFWFKSTQGLDATEMPRKMAFCEETMKSRALFVVPDALADARFTGAPVVAGEPHVRFYAGAPLVTPSGACIGSLCVLDKKRKDGLSEAQQLILTDLAATVVELLEARSRQIELVETTQEIAYLATHDPLTGLPNRSRLSELVGIGEKKQPIAALYLDLDGFKGVNDRLGHAAGDAILQQVAKRLCRILPSEAISARLGGDEFAVIVPGGNLLEKAAVIAKSIIAMLGQTYFYEGHAIDIGVSIGIALTDGCQGLEVSLRRADAALYQAKSHGRNCYRFAHAMEAEMLNAG